MKPEVYLVESEDLERWIFSSAVACQRFVDDLKRVGRPGTYRVYRCELEEVVNVRSY